MAKPWVKIAIEPKVEILLLLITIKGRYSTVRLNIIKDYIQLLDWILLNKRITYPPLTIEIRLLVLTPWFRSKYIANKFYMSSKKRFIFIETYFDTNRYKTKSPGFKPGLSFMQINFIISL